MSIMLALGGGIGVAKLRSLLAGVTTEVALLLPPAEEEPSPVETDVSPATALWSSRERA
jgi:hypothetical protein